MQTGKVAPLFKSVGSKTQLIPTLMKHLPKEFTRYAEPMVGGGALFWHLANAGLLAGKEVRIMDLNPGVIAVYQMVRDNAHLLIDQLEEFARVYEEELAKPSMEMTLPGTGPDRLKRGAEAHYYLTRAAYNRGESEGWKLESRVAQAAMFIFLRQTAFNGLWRHNQLGQLNMAWGKFLKPRIRQNVNILAARDLMQQMDLSIDCIGIDEAVRQMQREWRAHGFIYFDPPYYETFNKFTKEGISLRQHRALIRDCALLAREGATVLYSNSVEALDLLEEEMHEPDIAGRVRAVSTKVQARDKINRDGEGRKLRDELLVTFTRHKNAKAG